MKYINTSLEDNIGVITFNNDSQRNALSFDMLNEIIHAFKEFSHKKTQVIILKSNPSAKVWSAGLDISELPNPGMDPICYSHPLEKLLRIIENAKSPVIAMVTGTVWGGAFELAITCDMIIGTPNCSFAITPAKIGVAYNATGLIHFLNVVEMHIVKELFFTAKPISAERAYNHGILNNLVDNDKIEDFTFKLARDIARNSPLSISVIKEQLNLLGKSTSLTTSVFEHINELRSLSYNSYDYVEGKTAFLEKRPPLFKGE
ncbi:MAG: methylmalonyl-CoA decarboxylase [Bacteroidota bacterium]